MGAESQKSKKEHKYSVHKSIYFDLSELTNTMAAFLLTERMMRERKTSPQFVNEPLQNVRRSAAMTANA